MNKLRVVLDTNIFISAIFWEGDSYKIVKRAIDNEFNVFISQDIIKEIKRALKRDFNIGKEEIDDITYLINLFANEVIPSIKVDIVKDDPSDNRILECALACKAEYIVTQDNHLLKIREFKGTKIVSPKEFLDLL